MSVKKNLLSLLNTIFFLFLLISCSDSEKIASPIGADNSDRLKIQHDTLTSVMPTTTISFEMQENGYVSLKVYNSERQQVAVLIENELYDVGNHAIEFNVNQIASGVYFFHLLVGKPPNQEHQISGLMMEESRKLIIVK